MKLLLQLFLSDFDFERHLQVLFYQFVVKIVKKYWLKRLRFFFILRKLYTSV